MLTEVRKCAEAHDIKGLRYIFVDSLDVDPTFEKYRADYEHCKSIPGFFEDHQALNGIIADEKKWTDQYWEQLKLDLMKNFSMVRFEHMIAVARIIYADKIARLLGEREDDKVKSHTTSSGSGALNRNDSKNPAQTRRPMVPIVEAETVSDEELQKKRIAEKQRELAEENRRVEAERAANAAKREAARRESVNKQNVQSGGSGLKKVLGTVLGITVIVVVVLIIKALL